MPSCDLCTVWLARAGVGVESHPRILNPTPKVIMDHMPDTGQLTTEHVKSHLQKYRLHNSRYVR